nr:SDR family oxidoreductase [Microvirga puerhi]
MVTGGAQRIGRHLVERLSREGFSVAIHCNRSTAEAEELAKTINEAGGHAAIVRADLSDAQAVEGLIGMSHAAIGPLTLLVNNASEFEPDEVLTFSAERWDRHFAVNLRAPALLSRDFARHLPEEARGLIVHIVDQRVWKPTPQFFSYTLTKSALYAATRTMAQALAPRIRVNAIGPGPTLANARQDEDDFAKQNEALLLRRGSSPEDIGDALMYLLGARSVTGQMIAVDGGQHLAWETPDVTNMKE